MRSLYIEISYALLFLRNVYKYTFILNLLFSEVYYIHRHLNLFLEFSEGDVRLGSGDILEIWLNNSWTAVCSSVNLTQQTLDTACQSAGYTSGTSGNAVSISMATNQVLTGGLSCDATSKFLADCIEDDTVYGNRESCSTQQVVTVNCVGTGEYYCTHKYIRTHPLYHPRNSCLEQWKIEEEKLVLKNVPYRLIQSSSSTYICTYVYIYI